ncbi:unnamed protein product [Caenorhabditis nigoni]
MSNPLETDDKSIVSVLLYQFLQGKSAYSSFKQFNKVVKDNFISLDDFEFWFNRFVIGKFDEKDEIFWISDFKNMLSDDKHCLRACIFFEYLKEIQMKSDFRHDDMFAAYKRMNEVIDIDYPEFDFCFYRFLRGEFDLDFECNPAQICSFSDLPFETVRKIIKKLNFLERCRIRNLSYNLRNIVDDTKIGMDRIDILFNYVRISVDIKIHFFKYFRIRDTCVVEYGPQRKEFKGENFLEFASNDLSILLSTSKIDNLNITISDIESFINFENILSSLNTKLHAKQLSLTIPSVGQFVKILSYLKPETLEAVKIEYDHWFNDELEQEKALRLQASIFPSPVEYLINFPNIRGVQFRYIDSLQLEKIKEALLKLHNMKSLYFRLTHDYRIDVNEMNNIFGPIEADGVRHLEIPNSNAYYEIIADWFGMSIKKRNH